MSGRQRFSVWKKLINNFQFLIELLDHQYLPFKNLNDWRIDKTDKSGFLATNDYRNSNITYSLVDLLSASFAIFSFKAPLFAFCQQFAHWNENLKQIFGYSQAKNRFFGCRGGNCSLWWLRKKRLWTQLGQTLNATNPPNLEHNYWHGKNTSPRILQSLLS